MKKVGNLTIYLPQHLSLFTSNLILQIMTNNADKDNTYTITLNQKQANAVMFACEMISRLKMGQFDCLLDICLRKNINIDREIHYEIEQQLKSLYFPELSTSSYHGISNNEVGVGQITWDIYQVIRQYVSFDITPVDEYFTVNYDDPFFISSEPPIKITNSREIYVNFFKRFRSTIREVTKDMTTYEKGRYITKCKRFANKEYEYIKKYDAPYPKYKYNSLFTKPSKSTN